MLRLFLFQPFLCLMGALIFFVVLLQNEHFDMYSKTIVLNIIVQVPASNISAR